MVQKFRATNRVNKAKGLDENRRRILSAITKWAFKVICLLSTFILIVRGINRYLEDNDVTKIETPAYTNN